jgi:signal peptidase complex subunit 3
MHSALVRLQNVFGFFTTVAFSVAAVIALSSFITPQSPSASIQPRNVQVVRGRPHYYSYKKEEYANVKFDLDAGTSSPTYHSLSLHTH